MLVVDSLEPYKWNARLDQRLSQHCILWALASYKEWLPYPFALLVLTKVS